MKLKELFTGENSLLSNTKVMYTGILVLSIIALIPFILACFYIHPNADDWGFSLRINELGRLGFIKYFYYNWSGRYLAFTFLSIPNANIISNPIWYRVLPIIFIVLTNLILFKLLILFLRDTLSRYKVFVISVFFTAFYITGIPELFSALYWNCSSYYLLSNVFFLWLLYFILNYELKNDSNNIFSRYYLLSLLFIVGASGLTEIYIISLFVLLSIIIFYKFSQTKILRYDYLILLVLLCVGGYLNIFSPGTLNRMEVQTNNPSILHSSLRALYDLFIFQISQIFYSGFGLILIVVLLTGKSILKDDKKRMFTVPPLFTLVVVLLIFFLHHAASIYGAGYSLQGRVLNITQLLFYLSLLFLSLNVAYYHKIDVVVNKSQKLILLFAIGFISLAINFSSNSRVVVNELVYDLPKFDQEMKLRYLAIIEAIKEGKSEVIIDRISVNPRIFNLGEYRKEVGYYNSSVFCSEVSRFFNIEVKLPNGVYDDYQSV